MFFKILINYILGYVNVEIESFYVERFINMCVSKRIFLWNMNRKKSTMMTVSIGIEDFKNIKNVARKTNCKIKIKEKKGLPFVFNKYKKRKIFLVMIIIILICIGILSRFIWNIDVIGTTKINSDEIIKTLEESGLKVGTRKQNIDTKEIVNKIRLERQDIAWVGVDIKGTNVIVNIVEATEKPDIIKEEEYCNILADKKGVITKISALNGTPMVKIRRLSIRRNNFNCWVDGRKIYWQTICAFSRRS